MRGSTQGGVMTKEVRADNDEGTMARELGQSVVLLALAGSSVAGLLAVVSVATRALGL
jgi:hypothetical protein